MKPENAQELAELEKFTSFCRYTNDTNNEEYQQAMSRILLIKNPKGNYHIERRAAVHSYLSARNSRCKPSYLNWTRSNALDALSSIKIKYAGLV